MDYSLLGIIITAAVSIVSILLNNKNNSDIVNVKLTELEKRISQKSQDNMALIKEQIETLDENVQKHNCVIERTYDLERRIDVVETRIEILGGKK